MRSKPGRKSGAARWRWAFRTRTRLTWEHRCWSTPTMRRERRALGRDSGQGGLVAPRSLQHRPRRSRRCGCGGNRFSAVAGGARRPRRQRGRRQRGRRYRDSGSACTPAGEGSGHRHRGFRKRSPPRPRRARAAPSRLSWAPRSTTGTGRPVPIRGVVTRVGDGRYVHQGTYMTGYETSMGQCAGGQRRRHPDPAHFPAHHALRRRATALHGTRTRRATHHRGQSPRAPGAPHSSRWPGTSSSWIRRGCALPTSNTSTTGAGRDLRIRWSDPVFPARPRQRASSNRDGSSVGGRILVIAPRCGENREVRLDAAAHEQGQEPGHSMMDYSKSTSLYEQAKEHLGGVGVSSNFRYAGYGGEPGAPVLREGLRGRASPMSTATSTSTTRSPTAPRSWATRRPQCWKRCPARWRWDSSSPASTSSSWSSPGASPRSCPARSWCASPPRAAKRCRRALRPRPCPHRAAEDRQVRGPLPRVARQHLHERRALAQRGGSGLGPGTGLPHPWPARERVG